MPMQSSRFTLKDSRSGGRHGKRMGAFSQGVVEPCASSPRGKLDEVSSLPSQQAKQEEERRHRNNGGTERKIHSDLTNGKVRIKVINKEPDHD